jgi:ADP-heptose:LPS heptosyltransferase
MVVMLWSEYLEGLDLVISVDTAVAHLAGALGKPVWLMVQDSPDWRWLLNRAGSPWYPTLRLFRQSHRGDWLPVLEQVVAELHRAMCDRRLTKA